MPKVAILTIGLTEFALPPKVDAAKLLAALSAAEPVERRFRAGADVYFPCGLGIGYARELKLTYVDSRQLLPRDPGEKSGGPLRLEG